MLKVATVFSGIGAIEQALKRMEIPHKIVFACDNGGVDLLKPTTQSITKKYLEEKIKFLEKEIYVLKADNKKDEYIELIENKLKKQKIDLELNSIFNINKEKFIEILNYLNKNIKKFQLLNLNKLDENTIINDNIFIVYDYCTTQNLKKMNLDIINKFIEELKSNIEFKKIKRSYSEIQLELHQIEQVLETQLHLKKLSDIVSPKRKKEYVDNIYKERAGKNNVKKSYLANYKLSENNFHWNISLLDGNLYKGKVDLFVGGSPCQSFSMAGKRKGLLDTRGTLFYEFVRLINEIQPKFFIYENVKGILTHDKGKTWNVIQESFKSLGYTFTTELLNAKDFGIPQRRERIFVIGCQKKEDFEKLKEIKKRSLNLNMVEFLLDNNQFFNPKLEPEFEPLNIDGLECILKKNWYSNLVLSDIQKSFVTNPEKLTKQYTQLHETLKTVVVDKNNKLVERLCELENKNMMTQKAYQQYNLHGDFIEYDFTKLILSEKVKNYVLDEESSFNKKNLEDQLNTEIAKTIVASCHKMHRVSVDNYLCYINEDLKEKPLKDRVIRKLHPRECLRLMGFGDDFKIVVASTEAYKQAGNSIVVDVLIGILKSMENLIW